MIFEKNFPKNVHSQTLQFFKSNHSIEFKDCTL